MYRVAPNQLPRYLVVVSSFLCHPDAPLTALQPSTPPVVSQLRFCARFLSSCDTSSLSSEAARRCRKRRQLVASSCRFRPPADELRTTRAHGLFSWSDH